MERNNLFVYISKSTEPFLKEVAKEGTIKDGSHKNEVKRSRKESLMECIASFLTKRTSEIHVAGNGLELVI